MTDGHAPGAPGGQGNAHRALRDLVMAATVRIHRAKAGYALDGPGTFLGSGFFIAPDWVLTCAHVVLSGEGGEVTVVYETGPGRGTSAVAGEVVTALPEHIERAVHGSWPAPDLALVRLREHGDHDCAYVTERPATYYEEATVLYEGWSVVGGELRRLNGTCKVQGTLGGWSTDEQIRLGGDVLPPGVSGGPVVDPVRGEVVGVLKSQADRALGGTCTGVEQLRSLPVPASEVQAEGDDIYQAVFHAHDRYHRDRQRHPEYDGSTWADVQSQLRAWPGRAFSPFERARLLGRLADLPPPVSTRGLLDILEDLLGSQAAIPHPAPRGWRDGLGALYEYARQDGALELVIDYVVRVMTAQRPFVTPGTQRAERALWEWAWQAAEGLGSGYRIKLGKRIPALQRSYAVQHSPEARAARTLAQSADRVPRLFVLLELAQRGWEPEYCDWRVSMVRPNGEVVRLRDAERIPLDELHVSLTRPLAEAFRQCDEPGRPAVLQVALPHSLLALDVDAWRFGPDEPPLGVHRPVVVRCADRDQLTDGDDPDSLGWNQASADERHLEREARWRWIHALGAAAEVLDCENGLRVPVPSTPALRRRHDSTLPVLCRYGDHRFEDDPAALVRIVYSGYSVAMWRRWRGQPDAHYSDFHQRAGDFVAGTGSAERLPELVHALRVGLHAGLPETGWVDGVALLYDDPSQPLPGTGDLLEAP